MEIMKVFAVTISPMTDGKFRANVYGECFEGDKPIGNQVMETEHTDIIELLAGITAMLSGMRRDYIESVN